MNERSVEIVPESHSAASVSGNPNNLPDEAIVGKSQHGSAAISYERSNHADQ